MSYPNFKDKHKHEALFDPGHWLKWKGANFKLNNVIIIYSSYLERYIKRKYKLKKINLYSNVNLYQIKNVVVAKMTGIGAPHAATVMDELIWLGGKNFLNIGTAGGLKDFGVFIPDRAIRDEGTSHHYVKAGKYSYPDERLTNKFETILNKKGLAVERATTWTIDAPYRETKAEIKHYKKQGVKTVEMEASALFAVAKLRNVKIAAAFVVSDIVGEEKWDPAFDSKHVNQKLETLLESCLELLRE